MPQNQLIGLLVMGVGAIDAGIGHLMIAPRVPDESKRKIIKIAFTISGLAIGSIGLAIFTGRIPI